MPGQDETKKPAKPDTSTKAGDGDAKGGAVDKGYADDPKGAGKVSDTRR